MWTLCELVSALLTIHVQTRGYRVILLVLTNQMTPHQAELTEEMRVAGVGMGFVWIDVDDTALDVEALRASIGAHTQVIDACFSLWPFRRIRPDAEGPLSWQFLHDGFPSYSAPAAVAKVIEDVTQRSMTLAIVLLPFLQRAQAPRLLFHYNAVSSLTSASSSALVNMRMGFGALAQFIKAMSFEVPHCTTVGVHVGIWFAGLRERDAVAGAASGEEASDRFMLVFDSLDRTLHSGRTLRAPPVAIVPP